MNTQPNSYVITGGLGLIGSALTNAIKNPVTIINRSNNKRIKITNQDAKIVIKDIKEISTDDLINAKTIFHCASTVDNYNVLSDPYIDIETNINGTIHLLEQIKQLKNKPLLVYLSTFFVYGNEYDKTKIPVDENSHTDPLAIYPASKLCTESIIKLYSRLYGINYLITRLTNVYSENENYTNKKKGALNYMIMQAVLGKPLYVYKGGNFVRDYIHVDDVVSALLFLEKSQKKDTFLIGYGTPVPFQTIITYVHNLTGNKSKIISIEPPEFHNVVGIHNFIANTSKINNLGWNAKIDYKTALSRIVDHYKTIT
jgi:nucleoside-diphosphate-sugar epimerase